MFANLGAWEIILIVLVVIILFGAKKIPELAQGIGKGMKEFKKAVNEVQEDISLEDKPSSKTSDTKTKTASSDVENKTDKA